MVELIVMGCVGVRLVPTADVVEIHDPSPRTLLAAIALNPDDAYMPAAGYSGAWGSGGGTARKVRKVTNNAIVFKSRLGWSVVDGESDVQWLLREEHKLVERAAAKRRSDRLELVAAVARLAPIPSDLLDRCPPGQYLEDEDVGWFRDKAEEVSEASHRVIAAVAAWAIALSDSSTLALAQRAARRFGDHLDVEALGPAVSEPVPQGPVARPSFPSPRRFPYPIEGREDEIAAAIDGLRSSGRVVVHGVVGSGKSHVAHETIQRLERSMPNPPMDPVWIRCGQEDQFHADLRNLARIIGVPSWQDSAHEVLIRAVCLDLASLSAECLLVLTDATPQTVEPFLAVPRHRFLLTSTSDRWPGLAVVALPPLASEHIGNILQTQSRGVLKPGDDLDQVALALGGLPSRAVMAAHTAYALGLDSTQLRQDLPAPDELLEWALSSADKSARGARRAFSRLRLLGYARVDPALRLALDVTPGQALALVDHGLAEPGTGRLPTGHRGTPGRADPIALRDVTEAVRLQLPESPPLDIQGTADLMAHAEALVHEVQMTGAVPADISSTASEIARLLARDRRARGQWNPARDASHAAMAIAVSGDLTADVIADFALTHANYLREDGDAQGAKRLLDAHLPVALTASQSDARWRSRIRSIEGRILRATGESRPAAQALRDAVSLLGPDASVREHGHVRRFLAEALQDIGDAESLSAALEATAEARDIVGDDHPTPIGNLFATRASILRTSGRISAASQDADAAIETLGDDPFLNLRAHAHLVRARVHLDLGDARRAYDDARRAQALSDAFKKGHPLSAVAQTHVGAALLEAGNYSDAAAQLQTAHLFLGGEEAIEDVRHAWARLYLTSLRVRQGELDPNLAEHRMHQAVACLAAVRGPDHPDTLTAERMTCEAVRSGTARLDDLRRRSELALGQRHPVVARVMLAIARETDSAADRRSLMREVHARLEAQCGPHASITRRVAALEFG